MTPPFLARRGLPRAARAVSVGLALFAFALPAAACARGRDRDRDGLTDRFEVHTSRTDPRRSDTDRDGLRDRFELRTSGTDPRRADTDGDGVRDGREVRLGRDPRRPEPGSTPAGSGRPSTSPAAPPDPVPGSSLSPGGTAAPHIGRNCMPDPSACGFPDVESVGVLPGRALTPVRGTVNLNTPGEVYADKLVRGDININANNVTLRNIKLVSDNEDYAIESFDRTGVLLENVEIDMGGYLEAKGIAFDGYTARHVFFHNGSDCAHMGDNAVIEDSLCVIGPDVDGDGWPDGDAFCAGPQHFDGFQSDGGLGLVLRHNTIRIPCHQTSAILMSTNTAPIRDVTIRDNLIAGGGYSLYCDGNIKVPNETVTGNRFARTYFPKGGYYGPTAGCQRADVFSGNVWDDTGAAM